MRDLGAGGAGSLPARLESDGHRGGPSRAVDTLVLLRGGGRSGHDAGAVETTISLDQHDLAETGGDLDTATGAEEAGRDLHDSNRTLLRLAFEKAGVEFIDQNGGGPGVRLRDPIGGTRQEP